MQPAELNYDIHDKEMLAIVRSLEEWRAELEGLQTNKPFMIYSDYQALEYFITTKKLLAQQARQAEFLSRFHFKLMYRAGKANERADALSRKLEDVKAQDKAIEQYRTQVMIPHSKVDSEVIQDLQLSLIELEAEYNNIHLVEKLLESNRSSLDLQEAQIKAQNKKESTWELRDRLLLRYKKLYVPNCMLTEQMLLRTILIQEAHDQPLSGHPS